MSKFDYRDGVAVLQLGCFVIYLAFAFLLCSRHGFSRSSGWVILITFSLLRIIGSSFQLATINYPSRTTWGGALICQSIGLSPLTVLNIGLLSRVNRFVPKGITRKVFTLLSVASIAGISLAIYGGTKAANSSDPFGKNTEIKVAVVIFTGIYAVAVGIWLTLLGQWSYIPREENKLMYCFAICAPLIAVRLAYALIADFANLASFNVFHGNVTIYLCMAVLEEIVVVAFCVFTGLRLRILPKEGAGAPASDSEQQFDGQYVQKPNARY